MIHRHGGGFMRTEPTRGTEKGQLRKTSRKYQLLDKKVFQLQGKRNESVDHVASALKDLVLSIRYERVEPRVKIFSLKEFGSGVRLNA